MDIHVCIYIYILMYDIVNKKNTDNIYIYICICSMQIGLCKDRFFTFILKQWIVIQQQQLIYIYINNYIRI